MQRRQFVYTTGSAAAFLFASPALWCAEMEKKRLPKIGFIAGIVSNELKKDWKGTLQKAAEMGYSEVEIGRYLGESPGSFLEFCREVDLTPFAGGTAISGLLKDTQKAIDQALALKQEYLVCYWPWLTSAENLTQDECLKAADNLNRLGEQIGKAGLTFCFHNHDREFYRVGDEMPFDILMQNTDPKAVAVELDLYWVQKGGGDCIECLKNYPGRYRILHVKDMDNTPERSFACPGQGIIDFPAIFREALAQGIEHYIVEKDNEQKGLECLQVSAEYLKNLEI